MYIRWNGAYKQRVTAFYLLRPSLIISQTALLTRPDYCCKCSLNFDAVHIAVLLSSFLSVVEPFKIFLLFLHLDINIIKVMETQAI